MNIIFVNRYFHPDHSATSQMLSDLAFALAGRGRRIAIVTSRQLYDLHETRLPSRETVAEVQIHRVWTSHFGRHNLAGRAIDYVTFYLSCAWTLWRLARPGDVIVAKTDPPMLSVVAGLIARLRAAHLVNWLQDLFPEVAEALDDRRKPRRILYSALRALRNRSLRQARLNIVIGEGMADRLARLGVSPRHIRLIPNWADGTIIKPRTEVSGLRRAWGLEGKFVVGYSGNFGRAHEFATLIETVALLESARDVPVESETGIMDGNPAAITAEAARQAHRLIWLFVGGGVLYRQFQSEIAARGLSSVHFRPYQPRERLAESLSLPDVHLISLRPELEGLIVPSKYYGIAAAGRPAIFIGDEDGEIARLLKADNTGWTVSPHDHVGLAALIVDLAANPDLTREMGCQARSAFERRFDLPVAVAAWERALVDVPLAVTEPSRELTVPLEH